MSFLAQNNISHLNWSVNDKQEGASIIKPGTSISGNWQVSDLTPSGIEVRKIIRGWKQADISDSQSEIVPQKMTITPPLNLLLDD